MASFGRLALQLSELQEIGQDLWDDEAEEDTDKLKEFIKRGLEIRPEREDGRSFWDDFLALFGQNAALAADLFGVRQEAISRATNRARRLQDEVRTENDRSDKKRKKSYMMHTGDRF